MGLVHGVYSPMLDDAIDRLEKRLPPELFWRMLETLAGEEEQDAPECRTNGKVRTMHVGLRCPDACMGSKSERGVAIGGLAT